MAWSKAVTPGARYRMQVSGIGPPRSLDLPPPAREVWAGPEGELQAATIESLRTYLGIPRADGLLVSGASEATVVALAAHLARGDTALVETPAYAAFERCAQFAGANVVPLERREEDGWQPEPERLDRSLAESRASLVALTDPHNPTGVSIDGERRRALVEVIERRSALLVVDEIFAPFRGPGRSPAWASISERVLSLGSLTKAWGLSALRTGWVMGVPSLIGPCRSLYDLMGVNPPAATSWLAREALGAAAALDARALEASLRAHAAYAGVDWGEAGGIRAGDGIIVFLRLPAGWRSEAAARVLRAEDDVQLAPGHFFGRDDYLRIGFDPEVTDGGAACRRIAVRLNGPSPSA
jgi:aspartate/methionine/tyrosine aminotransferase